MELNTDMFGLIAYEEQDLFHFEEGLYGFEDHKAFLLIGLELDELPFYVLQSSEPEGPSFVVTNPFLFHEGYDFEVPEKVAEALNLDAMDSLAVYSLVVISDDIKESTMNMKAPLILNTAEKKGKQIILEEDFAYKQPLFKKEEA